MCFWKKRAKKVEKKHRKSSNIVSPTSENCQLRQRRNAVDEVFVKKLLEEEIICGGCDTAFSLRSNELKIHCNLCNQFFHCKVAGECIGDDCMIVKNGQKHRASYCYNCVGSINVDDTCLCRDCFTSK